MSKSRACCVSTLLFAVAACLTLAACVAPLVPYSTDTPPLVLAPAAQAGVIDERARFREIYCAVLEARRGLPGVPPGSGPSVVEFESTYLEFPILEYRPYRSFDTTQSSALILQLFGGVDIPNGGSVVYPPGAPRADLDRVYSIGVRLTFDWRRYF